MIMEESSISIKKDINKLKKLYEDQKQQLWVGTDDGLLCFDKELLSVSWGKCKYNF